MTARVLEVREERARGLVYDQALSPAHGSTEAQRAWISNSSKRFIATVEVTVDETFLDPFLDHRWGAMPELRDQEREHEITDVTSVRMQDPGGGPS